MFNKSFWSEVRDTKYTVGNPPMMIIWSVIPSHWLSWSGRCVIRCSVLFCFRCALVLVRHPVMSRSACPLVAPLLTVSCRCFLCRLMRPAGPKRSRGGRTEGSTRRRLHPNSTGNRRGSSGTPTQWHCGQPGPMNYSRTSVVCQVHVPICCQLSVPNNL